MIVGIERSGLVVGSDTVPLLSAAVHYFRLPPADWRPALAAVKGMGFHFVETYIPWAAHEQSDGTFDFGKHHAELDVGLFFRIASELGLRAIARPGPHINAELTAFGIPERVLWDEACMARGPTGAPVILPMVPRMFPVPSYASDAYHGEVATYFAALAPVLAQHCAPHGPICMVQIDNEGAYHFRDGIYDQDYHPDAIGKYRQFLRERYGDIEALIEAYPEVASSDEGALSFETLAAPRGAELDSAAALARHLDWAEFQEHLLAEAMGRFASALREAGLPEVVTMHNFPLAQDATPLDAERIGQHLDLIGLDYYNRASETDRRAIARRTSELAVRCDALGHPAFSPEMGAGFPPYFPPLSVDDGVFTLLAALAYGLRGFNLYMAVERDRWIGSPIDRRGRRRSSADVYARIMAALGECDWFALRRRVPVRIVIPRAERRLSRVLHAFGPLSGALLGVNGLGPREGCVETELGLSGTPAVDVDTLLRALEQSLEARGVPFAVVGGEGLETVLSGAEWLIVLTSGGLSDALAEALGRARAGGAAITVGPAEPTHDAAMRPLTAPRGFFDDRLHGSDPRTVDEAVAQHLEKLDIPLYACDPDAICATLHEDATGAPRVAFVINDGDAEVVARVTLGVDATWEDVLAGDAHQSDQGMLELRMRPHTVRMLCVRR